MFKDSMQNLAAKLISNKNWSANITITELETSKNSSGRTIYVAKNTYNNIPAVVSQVQQKYVSNNILASATEFTVPKINLSTAKINWQNKFEIEFNDILYKVQTIIQVGVLVDDNCLVKFICEK